MDRVHSVRKRIICLANSRKQTGRCVAGREFDGESVGPWLRPISPRPTEELAFEERCLSDGSEPRLLDILEIPLVGARPHACQVENHLIAGKRTWARVGRFEPGRVLDLCEPAERLWIDGDSSSNGLNDRIPVEQADRLGSSLLLVRPDQIRLEVRLEGMEGSQRPRVRARFALGAAEYSLIVTDPGTAGAFAARGPGRYPLGVESAVCVSLGEPFMGFRYKLAASVIDCGSDVGIDEVE